MSRGRHEDGAVMPLVALVISVIVLSVAFAVDLGRLANTSTDLQRISDVSALDAAWHVGGLTTDLGTLVADQALTSATRNGSGSATVSATQGSWNWTTRTFTAATPGSLVDAVKVSVTGTQRHAFQPGSLSPTREAIATRRLVAGWSAGSRLASISSAQASLLNDLFTGTFNPVSPYSITAASYTGLASATLTLSQIGAYLPVTAGSVDSLLTTGITVGEMLNATASALTAQGDLVNAATVQGLTVGIGSLPMQIGELVDVGPGGESLALGSALNVLNLLTATALIADTDHFVSMPAATATIPGVTSVSTSLTLIEGKRFVFGALGTVSTTAQITVSSTPVVDTTVPGWVGGRVTGSVPITAQLGKLDTTLSSVVCAGASPTTKLSGDPSLASTTVSGAPLTVYAKVGLVTIPVLSMDVAGSGSTDPAASTLSWLTPSQFGETRTIGATTVGLPGTAPLSVTSTTVLGTLPVPLDTMTSAVITTLGPIASGIDTQVISPIATLLGLSFGGGDVTLLSSECSAPVLVD